jgi:hypothetical protein
MITYVLTELRNGIKTPVQSTHWMADVDEWKARAEGNDFIYTEVEGESADLVADAI